MRAVFFCWCAAATTLLAAGCEKSTEKAAPEAPHSVAPARGDATPPAPVRSAVSAAHQHQEASPIPQAARQLVVALTDGWDDSSATLFRFARTGGEWQAVGESFAAVTGRSGLAWGRGLHGDGAPRGRPGPVKAEGDGRAVAGVFALGPAYGYASKPPAGARMRYVQSSASLRCVDDASSAHYAKIVDASQRDWRSAEHMRRDDDLYRLLVVVQHNTAERPGAGSCIFLHVWSRPDSTTSGCTAMPLERVTELVRWLEPEGALLVALPDSEYAALASPWQLPTLRR